MHPQPRAQKKQHVRARVFSAEAPESPAIPHAMVLLSMPCSPRGGALLRPSSCGRWLVGPGWGRRTSAGITPASGAGPHGLRVRSEHRSSCATVESSQPHLVVQTALSDHARHRRVHRISSRVRDDRDTPLVWDETERHIQCFEQKVNKNLFRGCSGQPETPTLA